MKQFVALILIIAFGCKLNAQCTIIPSAAFGNTIVCSGSSTIFSDSSTTSSGNINSWVWDFGDSSSLNLAQTPSHIYASGGSYNVTLIVTNSLGCADTIVKGVIVNPNPMVNFISDNTQGCQSFCTYFFDASIISSGTIIAWNWNFGDGESISTPSTVAHCYANASTEAVSFNVSLTLISDSGCAATKTIVNLITMLNDTCAASVNTIANDSGISMYPNPMDLQLTLRFEREQKNTQIKIVDMLGKQVKSINYSGKEFVFEKGDINSGIYFIHITDCDMNAAVKKIIVQ